MIRFVKPHGVALTPEAWLLLELLFILLLCQLLLNHAWIHQVASLIWLKF